jgi:type IV secretion system protein VirB9
MKHALIAAGLLAGTVSAHAQQVPPNAPVLTAPAPTPTVAPPVNPGPPPASRVAHRTATTKPSPTELRVRAANRRATREPESRAFVNAVQIYPYSDGALYRLLAAPEQVTDITLQPGEAIVSVAAGDTARWTVGDTSSGSGETKRVHILVKPYTAGLATNLIITTDRRAYHLQLESTERTAMAVLSWTYPQDELLAIRHQRAEQEALAPIAQGLAVENLNFNYAISGDDPAWRPLRAFDDGRQTFIEFPASITVGEAPPLFVVNAKGEASLVNYRMSGRFYVVDRLFGAAELRLGGKKQAIVRISRNDSSGRERRRRRAA